MHEPPRRNAALTPPQLPSAHVSTHPSRKAPISRLASHAPMRGGIAVRGRRPLPPPQVSLHVTEVPCGGANEFLLPPRPQQRNYQRRHRPVHSTIGRNLQRRPRIVDQENIPPSAVPATLLLEPTTAANEELHDRLTALVTPLNGSVREKRCRSPPLSFQDACSSAPASPASSSLSTPDVPPKPSTVFYVSPVPTGIRTPHDSMKRLRCFFASPNDQSSALPLPYRSTPEFASISEQPLPPSSHPEPLWPKIRAALPNPRTTIPKEVYRPLSWAFDIILSEDFWTREIQLKCQIDPGPLAFVLATAVACDAAFGEFVRRLLATAKNPDPRLQKKFDVESSVVKCFLSKTPSLWISASVQTLFREGYTYGLASLYGTEVATVQSELPAVEYAISKLRALDEVTVVVPATEDNTCVEEAALLIEHDRQICDAAIRELSENVVAEAEATELDRRAARRIAVLISLYEQERVCLPSLKAYCARRIRDRAQRGCSQLELVPDGRPPRNIQPTTGRASLLLWAAADRQVDVSVWRSFCGRGSLGRSSYAGSGARSTGR